MPVFECSWDEESVFTDYRERLLISPAGGIRCCESGVMIPEGYPYAECQGKLEGKWFIHPQALEVWRFVRNLRNTEGSCFAFEGVGEEVAQAGLDKETRIIFARWHWVVKRMRTRYDEGKRPKLHHHERMALESGAWFAWIQFPQGGKKRNDGKIVWPGTPAGEPWMKAEFTCVECGHVTDCFATGDTPRGWVCECCQEAEVKE